MEKAIYFDMDGTIADLYGQRNWLKNLRAEKVAPYEKARPMLDMQALKSALNSLRAKGYTIGIITWLSKDSTEEYKRAVRCAKMDWLDKHFGLGYFDKIHMVQYGTPKHKVATIKNAILFDDNEEVRQAWNIGTAHDEKNILQTLNGL